MQTKQGNLYRNTSFRNGGRKAGIGITEDDYSEDSGGYSRYRHEKVRFPHDGINPEELNGECVVVQKGKV